MKPAAAIARPKRAEKKTPPAGDSDKAATTPGDGHTPIPISPDEGQKLRECAAKTGQPVPEFVRNIISEAIAKLDDANLKTIPCPFCKRTDLLEVHPWTSERPDGTEYQGDAVRCNRCQAIAPVETWIMRGLSGNLARASRKGEPIR